VASVSGAVNWVTCYRCGKKSHIAHNCQKLSRKESDDNRRMSENKVRRPESRRLTT
jgi:hypothetical protein